MTQAQYERRAWELEKEAAAFDRLASRAKSKAQAHALQREAATIRHKIGALKISEVSRHG